MQPYVGEVRLVAMNFAPAGWLFCEGQLLDISEYETLFQLIGTTYGGDGQATFALPDLRGRVPVGAGSGVIQGESGGVEQVTVTRNQIPAHTHAMAVSAAPGTHDVAAGDLLAAPPALRPYGPDPGADAQRVAMSPVAVGQSGRNQPHTNMQPYLTLNYIISLFGVFPSPT